MCTLEEIYLDTNIENGFMFCILNGIPNTGVRKTNNILSTKNRTLLLKEVINTQLFQKWIPKGPRNGKGYPVVKGWPRVPIGPRLKMGT